VGEHNDDTPSGSSPASPHEEALRYYDAEEEEVKRHIERMIVGLRTLTWHRSFNTECLLFDFHSLSEFSAFENKNRKRNSKSIIIIAR